jgi:cellulose biosynthesis protein BcsQ
VLLAGDGPWVVGVEDAIRAGRGVSLASRCDGLAELLALAVAGIGDVAVLGGELDGLDLDSVHTLRRTGVLVVGVAASPDAQEWLTRLGVDLAVPPYGVSWADLLAGLARPDRPGTGSCLAVWGPPGGPGSTTVALALALASAASGASTVLMDLDPDGASVAQQLGLADSGSGVERACRAAQSGTLTAAALDSLTVTSSHGLNVLTGVLRPDRWADLRRPALEAVVEVARGHFDRVVCDVGSDLYDVADDSGAPRPSTATRVGLDAADHLVLVGSADPVGVARLLRGVDRLVCGTERPRRCDLVINRWRATVGWSRSELVGLLGQVAAGAPVTVLPLDVAAADAAVVRGGSPWLCRAVPGSGSPTALGTALHELTSRLLAVDCCGAPPRRAPLTH